MNIPPVPSVPVSGSLSYAEAIECLLSADNKLSTRYWVLRTSLEHICVSDCFPGCEVLYSDITSKYVEYVVVFPVRRTHRSILCLHVDWAWIPVNMVYPMSYVNMLRPLIK